MDLAAPVPAGKSPQRNSVDALAFPDGSSATALLYDLRMMERGLEYLLFLQRADDKAPKELAHAIGPLGRYKPTMGGQGVYELEAAGGIKAMGNDSPAAYELSVLKTARAASIRVRQAIDSLAPRSTTTSKPWFTVQQRAVKAPVEH